MYPEDEDAAKAKEEPSASAWVAFLGGFLIGWMIAAGVTALFHFIIDSFIFPFSLGSVGTLILFIAGPIGAFVGAYVGAGLVQKGKPGLGALIAILSIPVSVLLATHWVHVTPELLISPLFLADYLLIIIAGTFGGWLSWRLTQNVDWKEQWKVRGWEDLLYQDLLRKVRFNGSAANRLIEYERKQDPQASRLKLIQNAIERWERDNR
jgi:hypothetical protein